MGADRFKVEKEAAVVVLPQGIRVQLPAPELPEMLLAVINAVQVGSSAALDDNVRPMLLLKRIPEKRSMAKFDGMPEFGRDLLPNFFE